MGTEGGGYRGGGREREGDIGRGGREGNRGVTACIR